jgi:hypothetical protein
MRIHTLLIGLLLAASALPSLNAQAQQPQARHGNGGHGQPAPPAQPAQRLEINAVYDQLQVTRQGRDGLALDYTLSARTWAELRQANISPQLNLYAPDRRGKRYEFKFSVRLDRPQGRILYPGSLGIGDASTVEVQLVGFEGASHIARSTLGRSSEVALRLAVGKEIAQPQPPQPPQPPPRPPQPNHPPRPPELSENERRAQVIQACNSIGSFDSERRACQERAMSLRGPMITETIKACGKTARSAASWDLCFTYANANPYSYRVDTINACNEMSSFESDFKSCMSKVGPLPQPAAPIVRACKASSSFNSEIYKCMELAAPLGPGAEDVIRACKQGSSFNSDFQRCMTSANQPVNRGRRD